MAPIGLFLTDIKLINAKITAVAEKFDDSNKTQNYRTKALNKFKKNHIQILVIQLMLQQIKSFRIDIKNMNQVDIPDLPSVETTTFIELEFQEELQ